MSLSPLTPLPLGHIVNEKIGNNGINFTLPSYYCYSELSFNIVNQKCIENRQEKTAETRRLTDLVPDLMSIEH